MTAVIYLSGRDGTCRLLLPAVIARICQQGTRLCRVELCGWIGDREQTFLSRLPCSVLFLNDARWQERLCLDLDMQISPWHHPCLMDGICYVLRLFLGLLVDRIVPGETNLNFPLRLAIGVGAEL